MHVERVTLTNFRCFGPDPTEIGLDEQLTALIGANASGKTATLLALLRLFGVSQELRHVRVEDFHVPADEDPDERPTERQLSIDVVLSFPELTVDGDDDSADDEGADAVPEFFQQMAAEEGGVLKCRLRLEAHWQADGSVSGSITESRRVIRTLDEAYEEDDWSELHAADRARIQMIYVPAARDGAQHLTSFLRSRLWRAAVWSDRFRNVVTKAVETLNTEFGGEGPVSTVEAALSERWTQLHTAGTDAEPAFRPVSAEFDQFVGRADLFFEPTETGQARRAAELSDGQRSLLHIALTATVLDIERDIASGSLEAEFDGTEMGLPTLTILAVEEPENSLAPFYLSRIVSQMLELGESRRAQMVLSSHSPSVLSRVDPTAVRHFRLREDDHTTRVNAIHLPDESEDAGKYIREAVRAYPELYFARFIVLGEGDSEQIALPILAQARGLFIDRSFVAVVPLGGRHVVHLWKLLHELDIPHATLLDLDWGRDGAGIERIRHIHGELEALGYEVKPEGPLDDSSGWDIDDIDESNFLEWVNLLRDFCVYFCDPLDLDWTLMTAFWDDYAVPVPGGRGPRTSDATDAVLGKANDELEDDMYVGLDDELRWYRYLFLNRSKPSTHLRVLTGIPRRKLSRCCPEVLDALLDQVEEAIS